MDENIFLFIASIVITIIITFFFSHLYYKKNIKDLGATNKKLSDEMQTIREENKTLVIELQAIRDGNANLLIELSKVDNSNKVALNEDRINRMVELFSQNSLIQNTIDTFSDLTDEEKAKMYDDVLLRARGTRSRINPYRK